MFDSLRRHHALVVEWADTTVSEAVVARHGSSSLSERTNSPRSPIGRGPALNAGKCRFEACRGYALVAQLVEAAASRAACCRFESCAAHQIIAPFAKAAKASGLHPDIRRFESVREHHLMACSSMAEPALDRRLTWVRFPTGQPKWTRSLKPRWRGSGLLTRGPVDRNHSRPLCTLSFPCSVRIWRGGPTVCG